MRKIVSLFCLALFTLTCLHGQSLTVYPGDANNSRLCNHVDLLHIGLNYGATGPMRNFFPNIFWAPQQGTAWSGPVGLDVGYSDCNGDSVVDRNDALAIEANFMDSIPGVTTLPDTTSFGSVVAPHLTINMSQDSVTIPVNGQVAIQLNVELGSPTSPVDSIYGYSYTLDFDPVIVDQLTFAFAPNSFAIDSAGLTFFRIDTARGRLYVSATNVDHVNRAGSGVISTLGIVMDDDIRISAIGSLFMQPTSFLAYTSSAALVPVYPQGDSLTVITSRARPTEDGIDIYPNPAGERVAVRSTEAMTALRICDLQGRTVVACPQPHPRHQVLETAQLPAGCYFLEIHASERVLRKRLVIQ